MNAECELDFVFQNCWEKHWVNLRSKWKHEAVRLYEKHLKPEFGLKKLKHIKRLDVKIWMESLHETPGVANTTFSTLSKLFKYAQENSNEEIINPCNHLKKFHQRHRKRYASEDELIRLVEVLSRYRSEWPEAVLFTSLLIYTGSRPEAILGLRKENIEWIKQGEKEVGKVTFEGKTGEDTIYIPGHFRDLWEIASTRSPNGLQYPRYFWAKICEEAGVKDLWLRDLRRTYATIALSGGESLSLIGEMLNHRCVQTTKIYGKLMDTSRMEAALRITKMIEGKL